MPVTVAKVWRPYVRKVIAARKGTYTGLILRDKHVTRRSEKVKKVNIAFKQVAKSCAGKPLKEFQECVAKGMEGKTFG